MCFVGKIIFVNRNLGFGATEPSTHFFYKKLSSEMSTQFLSVSSTQFLRSFSSERDLCHF